ncbi:serine protease [Desmonostoc muscorum LEGE 12446]|nr:serine protease [Desmonostoc muscorum]MCF2148786.1 serine protease [Desmonostoc muscorum LEGE 12446]
MLNRYILRGFLIGALIITGVSEVFAQEAVQPTQTLKELQPTEVAAIARGTVVRIESTTGSSGSGIISDRYQEGGKNVYIVVTAKSVVQDKSANYDIVTPLPEGNKGNKRQKIRISTQTDIEELADEDLAIVRFESTRTYKTAKLVVSEDPADCLLDDPQLCNGVYVGGFANPPAGSKKLVFHVTQLTKKDKSKTYSNLPPQYNFAGMTGGPVFDGSGRVVTIYGKTNTQKKAIRKRKGFGSLQRYSKFRIRLDKTPPLLTISLRGDKPFNLIEEEDETAFEVVNQQPAKVLPLKSEVSVPRVPN